jgi:molybdopterin-guanine dinucleotide biosynthesis protein A
MSRPSARRVGLVVLTGGASSRMGADKASLDAGGAPLALRPVETLRPLCGEVVLAGRPVPGIAARAVPDAHPGQGPLAGVVSGLAALTSEFAVVVGCDMPEVEPALVALLLELLNDAGRGVHAAACTDRAGRLEPLPLVVRTEAAAELRATLDAGARALREGLAALAVLVVAEPDWRAADPRGTSFENWNRPSDIRPLRPLVGG